MWLETSPVPRAVRRCVRDGVTLSTLLAIWRDYDPQQIAAALVSMVGAEFVYISLPDRYGIVPIEVLRAGDALSRESLKKIQAALRVEFSARTGWQQWTIANPGAICRSIVEAHGSMSTRPNLRRRAVFFSIVEALSAVGEARAR